METILETLTGLIFGVICHQDPSILMESDGKAVLLCPRCIGLHLGFLSSFVVMALSTRRRITVKRRETRLVLAIGVASMALDWGLGGHLGLFAPTTFSRLATGLACAR